METENYETSLKLVLRTRTHNVKDECVIITQLFNEGLEQLDIYKPGFTMDEMNAFIGKIPAVYHSRIMLYSHYCLVKKYNLKGVHINQHWLQGFFSKIKLKYMLGGKKVQMSTTVYAIKSIAECPDEINEILLGPVFVNSGNDIINMSFRREVFERGIRRSKSNVIVMGGVCEKNIAYLKSLDIKGVLLHSTIWDSLDPVKAFEKIRNYSHTAAA